MQTVNSGQRIAPPAHQEAHELCGMLSDLVSRLHAAALEGDEGAAHDLLALRDELHTVWAEARKA